MKPLVLKKNNGINPKIRTKYLKTIAPEKWFSILFKIAGYMIINPNMLILSEFAEDKSKIEETDKYKTMIIAKRFGSGMRIFSLPERI